MQSVVLGQLETGLNTLLRLLVKLLRNGGRAAFIAHTFDKQRPLGLGLPHGQRDSRANFKGGFDIALSDLDMPLAHLLRCERASFEKTRRPEPFVNANAFHHVELVSVFLKVKDWLCDWPHHRHVSKRLLTFMFAVSVEITENKNCAKWSF